MKRLFLREGTTFIIEWGIEFLVEMLLTVAFTASGIPPFLSSIVAVIAVRGIMLGLKKLTAINFKKQISNERPLISGRFLCLYLILSLKHVFMQERQKSIFPNVK